MPSFAGKTNKAASQCNKEEIKSSVHAYNNNTISDAATKNASKGSCLACECVFGFCCLCWIGNSWLLLHSNSICLPQGYRCTNSLSILSSSLLFRRNNLSICFLLKRVSTATNINPLESIDLPASSSVQALDRSIHSSRPSIFISLACSSSAETEGTVYIYMCTLIIIHVFLINY